MLTYRLARVKLALVNFHLFPLCFPDVLPIYLSVFIPNAGKCGPE